MKNLFARFANDESGATAIEYGLIAGLISIAIVTAVTTAGGSISSIFTTVSTKLTAAQGNVKLGSGSTVDEERNMLEAALLVVFPCLLAFAGASDLFTMTIPNRVSLLLVAGFAVLAPFIGLGPTDIGLHLLAAALTLCVGFAFFAFGWMGGGDAKVMTVVALWFGFTPAMLMFVALAGIYGAVLTLGLLMFRQTYPQSIWFQALT
eukprot:jgi/Tetstr1/435381/TSEL_024299.t1